MTAMLLPESSLSAAAQAGSPGLGPLAEVWAQMTSTQPDPAPAAVAATALLAAALVLPRAAWRRTRHAVTIAHEGGHALVAVLCGRRLSGIHLHSDTSGLTVSRGRAKGPGMVATLMAGYTAPALLGLAAAWVLGTGHAVALLWGFVALLVLLVVQVRNWFGLWSVLVTGLVVGAASYWLPEQAQSTAAHLVAWFLLLAAPRPVVELVAERSSRRRGSTRSDPDQLARLTHVPAALWVAFFAVVTGGALLLGGRLLLA